VDSLPTPTGKVPVIPSDVTGQAVFADNSSYTLTGMVDEEGVLHANGAAADNSSAQLQIDGRVASNGKLDGTFDLSGNATPDTGTIDGQQQLIGDCQAVQKSGGKGTFTNAHFVGKGGGTTTFSYDAFNVPDAFTVRSSDFFSTPGLVSGAGTKQLAAAVNGF